MKNPLIALIAVGAISVVSALYAEARPAARSRIFVDAEEQLLSTAETDKFKYKDQSGVERNAMYSFLILTDRNDGSVVGLRERDMQGRTYTYLAEELAQKGGQSFLKVDGRDVIKIELKNFDKSNGGEARLWYLKNGAPWCRLTCDRSKTIKLEIDRVNGKWVLFTNDSSGRNMVNHMFFRTNHEAGIAVGIASVTFSFRR